MNRLEFILS